MRAGRLWPRLRRPPPQARRRWRRGRPGRLSRSAPGFSMRLPARERAESRGAVRLRARLGALPAPTTMVRPGRPALRSWARPRPLPLHPDSPTTGQPSAGARQRRGAVRPSRWTRAQLARTRRAAGPPTRERAGSMKARSALAPQGRMAAELVARVLTRRPALPMTARARRDRAAGKLAAAAIPTSARHLRVATGERPRPSSARGPP
jgi:hypothetical protein